MSASARPLSFVDTPEIAADVLPRLVARADGATIALDIEEDREHRFSPRVALIQVTVGDDDFVLDPLRIPRPLLDPAVEALCIMPRAVVMHGCRNDVTGLKRDFGIGPIAVCDTQIAARFLGAEAFGLAHLVQARFGLTLDKELRRSNWIHRPLTPGQVEYARQDTQHLERLWDALISEVERRGWLDAVEEECEAMGALVPGDAEFDPEGWRSIKGLRELASDQLPRVAALWRWRYDVGAELDQHPSRVLAPWALLRLARGGARACPSSDRVLPAGLSPAQRAHLVALLEAPPPLPPRARVPRAVHEVDDDVFDARMALLARWRADTAAACGLELGFLVPRSVLEGIARLLSPTLDAISGVPEVRAWRVARWGAEWAALLG